MSMSWPCLPRPHVRRLVVGAGVGRNILVQRVAEVRYHLTTPHTRGLEITARSVAKAEVSSLSDLTVLNHLFQYEIFGGSLPRLPYLCSDRRRTQGLRGYLVTRGERGNRGWPLFDSCAAHRASLPLRPYSPKRKKIKESKMQCRHKSPPKEKSIVA